MRCLLLVLGFLAACVHTDDTGDDGNGSGEGSSALMACATNSPCPPGEESCTVQDSSGLTNRCSCVGAGGDRWWACSNCPFGEGTEPVACATPGLGCNITTWEHDCSCSCTNSGYWNCTPGTIGSTCPQAP
jgi:hypothetical protein